MLDPQQKSGVGFRFVSFISSFYTNRAKIRFLGDPQAEFTNAMDLAFDATAIFGQPRSKRYALLIENGKVKETHVEPDNTGVDGKSCLLSYGRPGWLTVLQFRQLRRCLLRCIRDNSIIRRLDSCKTLRA